MSDMRALVRGFLAEWDPYARTDAEVDVAIAHADASWTEARERIAAELNLSPKQRAEREPLPPEYVAWDAALLISQATDFEVFVWARHDGYEVAL